MRTVDLTGRKFGKLTVLRKAEPELIGHNRNQTYWVCQCDCGNSDSILVTTGHLTTGHTKSCGCLKKLFSKEHFTTHGMTGTRIYTTWIHMKQRCTNPKDKEYHRYGGRGIMVCDDWLRPDGFESFYKWAMENGYQDHLTIDRIDNNGNYTPENCRWATKKQQMNNVDYNVRLTYNNVTHTIAEWAEILGLKQDTIQARIKYYGYSIEDALFKKPTCKKKTAVLKDGVVIKLCDSQKEAAEFAGVFTSQVSNCIHGKVISANGYQFKKIS